MTGSIFSSAERERYARHLVLPEIGGAGQQKLKQARVLVVGAGGLGAPALQYLAAAGVGHLTIVDDDVVSLSNLQRQVIHATKQVGKPKVESAAKAIGSINPHVEVETEALRFSAETAPRLLKDKTLVLDGSDNFDTRYITAEACEQARIPLVTAAVNRFDGSLTTLRPWESDASGAQNPRYRDLFPNKPPDDLLPTCAEAGVLGAVTGVLGALQAMEAIKQITGAGEGLVGRLLMFDGLAMRFDTIRYKRTGAVKDGER